MEKKGTPDPKMKNPKSNANDQTLTTTNTEVLTKEQLEQQLRVAEEKIENAIKAFWIAADALKKIRDQKLFESEYKDFPEYLAARWGYSESYVSRLITAGYTRQNLLTDSEIKEKQNLLPIAYSFYYALSEVDPAKQLEILKSLLAALGEDEKLTVKKLMEVISSPEDKEKNKNLRLSTAISTIKSLASEFDPDKFFKKGNKNESVEKAKKKFIDALRIILEKMEADIKDTKAK
jgi:hypothetical protein